jgi:mono/diheme cytochrome c family protein
MPHAFVTGAFIGLFAVREAESEVPDAASYTGPVERAFTTHCADCHGVMPASLSGAARATADKKRKRAHRKFGMDEGFPFTSKWPLPKLLAEIRSEVADEDMPPVGYMKKKGVTMTDAERQVVVDWTKAVAGEPQPD